MTSLDLTPWQFLATLAVIWLVWYFIQRRLNPVSASEGLFYTELTSHLS